MITYDDLKRDGYLGYYKSCSIDTLFALKKESKDIIILFAKVKFIDDTIFQECENTFKLGYSITSELGDEYMIGLYSQIRNIDYANNLYSQINQFNTWPEVLGLNVSIGKLTEIYPKYVKADSKYVKPWNKVPLSELLIIESSFDKINPGSYVIEFFDENKDLYSFIYSSDILNHLNEIQSRLPTNLPFNIEKFPDKLGSVFFEFPIHIIKMKRLDSECKIFVDFLTPIEEMPNPTLLYEYEEVDRISRKTIELLPDDRIISFTDDKEAIKVTIYDQKRKIVIGCSNNCEYERPYAGRDISLSVNKNKTRLVLVNQTTNIVDPVFVNIPMEILLYRDWINFRINTMRIKDDELKLTLKMYYGNKNVSFHEEALKDLVYLINKHGKYGIFILDPYISATDMLSTLYFCKYGDVKMKVIGKEIPNDVNSIKNELLNGSNQFGINIEFRVLKNIHSAVELHDRFIIFPYCDVMKRPRVWSIGTSINSVGYSFHVLVEVNQGGLIKKKFEELWAKMDGNGNCIVFKYP